MNTKTTTSPTIIAAMLILLCLLPSWPHVAMADPYSADLGQIDSSKPIVVSMGDSYSSGQGAPPYYGKGSKPGENGYWDLIAHRSQNAWSSKLRFGNAENRITLSDYHDSNWLFVASTGAVSTNITGEDKNEGRQDPQEIQENYALLPRQTDIIDELHDAGFSPDYVTLTIGGNDIGFTNIAIKNLVAAASDAVRDDSKRRYGVGIELVSPSYISDAINGMWKKYYESASENIERAYEAILKKTEDSNAVLLVAGYPLLFAPTDRSNQVINAHTVLFDKNLEILTKKVANETGRQIEFIYVFDAFGDIGIVDDSGNVNATITDKYGWHGAGVGGADEWINGYGTIPSTLTNKKNPLTWVQEWIHPNWCRKIDCGSNGPDCGMSAYAAAVQARIDQISQQAEDKASSQGSEISRPSTSERDIAMVLDVSGSMAGDPLDATKNAASRFVDVALDNGAQTALVSYDDDAEVLSEFTTSGAYLKTAIGQLGDGGGTNMESGLSAAKSLLMKEHAKSQYVVLMSDGEPNDGKTGDELVSYARSIRDPDHDGRDDVIIYTLGFNESGDGEKLLRDIASKGCYFSVHDTGDLEDFFQDMVDSINGVKFMYARVACPVDVSVTFGGETLDSAGDAPKMRTSFGSLTFEEDESSIDDDPVKVLRLREGQSYDISIDGTGFGTMDYSIGFIDDGGIYSDFRTFSGIDITDRTAISTTAEAADTTTLAVDEDGDGTVDKTYRAGANQEGELVDNSWIARAIVAGFAVLALFIAGIALWRALKKRQARVAAQRMRR